MEDDMVTGLFPDPAKRLHLILYKFASEKPKMHEYIRDWYERTKLIPNFYKCQTTPKPGIDKGYILKGGFKTFLSNNGNTKHLVRSNGDIVHFDSLEGKFLVICCFALPVTSRSSGAEYCRALINVYPYLVSHGFEMVLAVKMKLGFPDDSDLFNHFFSAFPCLAIPFPDRDTRLSVCSSILAERAIVVDPHGLVLYYRETLNYFRTYGRDWYVFPNNALQLHDEDFKIGPCLDPIYAYAFSFGSAPCDRTNWMPLSLWKDILFCDPFLMLNRCGQVGTTSVKDLSEKYVGLYLCIDGMFMEKLKEAHDHCLANKQELEIVVVCMSIFDDPKFYMKDLHEALEICNIKSWFLYEPDDTICRRIYRRFGELFAWPDRFIIVPPNCKDGELEGKVVITLLGIQEYPFTRSAILHRRLKALNSVTVPSLFNKGTSNSPTCLLLKGEKYEPRLQNKKLLIYLDWLQRGLKDPTEVLLEKHYSDIKARGWEVVFVPLDTKYISPSLFSPLDKMPWPYMPLSDAIEARVVDQLTFPEEEDVSYIIAVGEDGKIRSRDAEDVLETEGLTESLFNNVLYEELALRLSGIAVLLEYKD